MLTRNARPAPGWLRAMEFAAIGLMAASLGIMFCRLGFDAWHGAVWPDAVVAAAQIVFLGALWLRICWDRTHA